MYGIRYDTNYFEIVALISNNPQKGNATRLLKFLLHIASKHNVKLSVYAYSRSIVRGGHNSYSTQREYEYYYWRALLMYQRVGFKPLYRRSFVVDIKRLYPVYLIT